MDRSCCRFCMILPFEIAPDKTVARREGDGAQPP